MFAAIAASPSVGIVVGIVLTIIGGLLGAAGWLTGGYRKSVASARDADIKALDHRVTTLTAEKVALEAKVEAQRIAIETLMEHARGSNELANLTAKLTEVIVQGQTQYKEAMGVIIKDHEQMQRTLEKIMAKL